MQEVADALRLDTELSADSAAYIEELYEQYLSSPTSVGEDWQQYFDKFPKGDQPHGNIREQFLLLGRNSNRVQPVVQSEVSTEHERRQIGVLQLIAAYRNRGHQKAKLDPLGLAKREDVPDLDLAAHGLTKSDLDTVFNAGNLAIGKTEATLGELVNAMEATYCASIGVEYMHIVDTKEKRWIQQRLEGARGQFNFSADQKKHVLERLTAAEGLEKFLGNKYVGAKRFGVEGGESFIPMVNELIQRAGSVGCKEVVIGMPHRGRLNLLVNIMGKNPADLFGEFEGKALNKKGSGDVKYHQGFSSNVMTPGGEVHLALAFNPSHLEIVGPVVEGSVRARQVRRKDIGGDDVLPIIVHGDAAFAGQGVNQETFQMSQTRGYTVGGTVHIVVNNQVGFTTSDPRDARSTEYCTDIAKMIQAPIFHVNGDDPEAVLFVSQLAHDFRHTFRKDVVIDMFCYRRRGHNEADEPAATQPMMYQVISKKATTRTLYADQLVQEKVLDRAAADALVEKYREDLEAGNHVANALVLEPNKKMFVDWSPYLGHDYTDEWDTRFPIERLKELGQKMRQLPEGFVMQRQVSKVIDDRLKMQTGEMPLNWGAAETLAYASLLDDGFLVRLTGEDVGRGTFSHRHAKLHNQVDGSVYIPLCHIKENQPRTAIYDSLLSELAVLAFEYGYSTTLPKSLIVWEAQFGDFANCAQMVIDQFIASGETKWERVCGLTMLLPHGFEGQGPEHSSARLERYLQLCAEENMQVITPTTPAQIYHVLRRQAIRPLRKPLIVMSPKSLLRHKLATSTLDELATGTFQTVIDEVDNINKQDVTRVVLCGGKVYYDLLEKRREENLNIAIVRVEQLYPYPEQRLAEVLAAYPNVKELVWCQEEPKNQGAWLFIAPRLYEGVMKSGQQVQISYAGREASAAPACGSPYLHAKQQAQLVNDALAIVAEQSGESK
ncbi:2-oxoglutarate dehydrogenase E1 component [Acinetobacter wuhouensis]|uniref:2-oxoglutarate dehydrogenase E1 component n=1 Tax=Acinetobacter wuhouensis TaxID=1879050 RepID=A0A385C8Q1_9GAMM|nr:MULTISPECIES: 2-oxoglutarate dehydrogenase E1 component [Acinetobacter]AXQ24121.1 2-oxoglutarate dehydrogenase E1 component [Acinetobacter wuhouensis]AYO56329.1 2-oxoglutarate dehydrogenase E1 component [Acinetobacter wuhouensis]RZG45951.1 2-oxoglutarate dehydrogenase E1 component [Acinetobacter wuhouensis]RZG72185.1 2-oxoglutarate dehydrogenase E1 component [Acinetobacter wuhouensis]RZG73835.1 2-oxoglutarate dehydrogenase E1 component [Acinetobacter sp. WCHAc060025]